MVRFKCNFKKVRQQACTLHLMKRFNKEIKCSIKTPLDAIS